MKKKTKNILKRARLGFRYHNKPMVDFIIGGAQKSGTSALYEYLREHPEICMADRKEVHFFDDEKAFRHKAPSYSIYHSYFSPKPSHKLIGEATPSYMYWHDAPRRIWEYNPNMKFLIILRNPIDRAFSHWNMARTRNKDNLSFWDVIHAEEQRCRKSHPYQNKRHSYVDRGFYSAQLRRLWFYFSKENVLVLRNEALRNDPNNTLQEISRFLQTSPFGQTKPKAVHARPYTSFISNREKNHLLSLFEYEIRQLERMLGWDCKDWLE